MITPEGFDRMMRAISNAPHGRGDLTSVLIAEAQLAGARALLSFLRQRAVNPDNAVAEITVEAIDDLMTSDDALRHILVMGSKRDSGEDCSICRGRHGREITHACE